MALTIKPILPGFGAEISGIDICKPLDEGDRRQVRNAIERWGVCVYRETGLDNETHVQFSRVFGHLEQSPTVKGRIPRFPFRELFDVSNLNEKAEIVKSEAIVLRNAGDRLWHTDSSFMEVLSSYSLLLAHEVPPVGGATWFADTRTAYDDLPNGMKERIAGLELEHSFWHSRRQAGFPITAEDVADRPKARHPLVMAQPSTGRSALFIAAHAYGVVGMPQAEGQALIQELIEWATQPQYVFSVTYQPGDLVIWNNLTSMHRGGEFDVLNHRRDMRRTTVRAASAEAAPPDIFTRYFVDADYSEPKPVQ